jgi:hypothetical protein
MTGSQVGAAPAAGHRRIQPVSRPNRRKILELALELAVVGESTVWVYESSGFQQYSNWGIPSSKVPTRGRPRVVDTVIFATNLRPGG